MHGQKKNIKSEVIYNAVHCTWRHTVYQLVVVAFLRHVEKPYSMAITNGRNSALYYCLARFIFFPKGLAVQTHHKAITCFLWFF